MKAILISDYAKWCALMMNGIKNIEVRKNKALAIAIQKLINKYGYAEIYVYCAKGKPNLWLPYEYDCFELDEASQPYLNDKPIIDYDYKMNGKVIFKFRCYKVEEITPQMFTPVIEHKILKKSCLKECELFDYVCSHDGMEDKPFYAIHISNLEIFDKPKELSEFHTVNKIGIPQYQFGNGTCDYRTVRKAPQNYCYVEGV